MLYCYQFIIFGETHTIKVTEPIVDIYQYIADMRNYLTDIDRLRVIKREENERIDIILEERQQRPKDPMEISDERIQYLFSKEEYKRHLIKHKQKEELNMIKDLRSQIPIYCLKGECIICYNETYCIKTCCNAFVCLGCHIEYGLKCPICRK